jgi:hypothetical protein
MKKLLIFLTVFIAITASAQRFGGFKPSVKWKQVSTPAARVIFSDGLDSTAMRVATVMGSLNNLTAVTIGAKQNTIDVVLQPRTTISNAYVQLGPFRSELFLTPPQNSFELGSIAWHDNLALHEYRHVQQYNSFNVGLSKLMRVLFGQQGQELANAASVPNWFWEGDAVYQESLLSGQGRGRLPFFFNDYRSLWATGKKYHYMKLRNGSLRDFVPDHYRLGYMLVAYGREKYGNDFWKKVTQDAAAYKGLFYPFQQAIKQHTGSSFTHFTKEALQYWQAALPVTVNSTTQATHFIADEEHPVFTNTGSIIYVRTSYKKVHSFVERANGKERLIRVRDASLDNYFSYRNGTIVYASYKPDTRWNYSDYSELQVLNTATGEQQTITHKTRYFSPDISEDGKTIIAVAIKPGGTAALHVLDAITGAVLKKLPNTAGIFYTYPKFINENKVVAAVRFADGTMGLQETDISTGATKELLPASKRVIAFPVVYGTAVYFSASNGLKDDLFFLDTKTGSVSLIMTGTNGVGAYQPNVDGDHLVFNSFTATGYRIQQTVINTTQRLPITIADWQNSNGITVVDFTKDKAAGALLNTSITAVSTIKPYSKTTGFLNFHSLQPLISDPEYSFSLIGNNVLNTTASELQFTYNRNEQSKQLGFNTLFGGWFPYIRLGTDYTLDRRALYRGNRVYFNEFNIYGGLQLPFNFSKGRYFTRLNIGSNIYYTNPQYRGFYKDSIGSRNYTYSSNFINFSNQVQQARMQIHPRFAQTVTITYRNALSRYTANQLQANSYWYFPGVAVTHSFVVNAAVAMRDKNNQVRFSNGFPFSRGYTSENLYRMYKVGANYHFPLLYPDWGFGNLVYVQRVRANAYYDFSRIKEFNRSNQLLTFDFRSAGAELFFDTKWWNELPLSFGVRYSRLLDTDIFGNRGNNWFEFVLPVNLLQR